MAGGGGGLSEDGQVTDLFERAVAVVPPPHATIRRRIRRRATGWAVAAVAVLAGIVVAAPGPPAEAPEPAASTARPPASGVPWHTARIDRTGTRITVYATPLPGKCLSHDADDDEVTWSDGNAALYLAGVYEGCADDRVAGSHRFELPQALGGRTVLDAREPAGDPVVCRESDLPDLPADGWSEAPATWVGGGTLTWRHDRQGSPGVAVTVTRWEAGAAHRLMEAHHTLAVAGRSLDIDERPGGLSAAWVSADQKIRFTLAVVDASIDKSEFDEMLRDMTWS